MNDAVGVVAVPATPAFHAHPTIVPSPSADGAESTGAVSPVPETVKSASRCGVDAAEP